MWEISFFYPQKYVEKAIGHENGNIVSRNSSRTKKRDNNLNLLVVPFCSMFSWCKVLDAANWMYK